MTELEVFQQSLRVSQISLGVSVLISTVSIVFGVLSMAFQRSHNRKSVKPFCNVEARRTADGVSICITNAGLGPMRVTDVHLQRNAAGGDGKLSLAAALPDGSGCSQRADECIDRVLPPLADFALIELPASGSPQKGSAVGSLKRLQECSLVVTFKDIYDHEYEKVEPLGRHLCRGGTAARNFPGH